MHTGSPMADLAALTLSTDSRQDRHSQVVTAVKKLIAVRGDVETGSRHDRRTRRYFDRTRNCTVGGERAATRDQRRGVLVVGVGEPGCPVR